MLPQCTGEELQEKSIQWGPGGLRFPNMLENNSREKSTWWGLGELHFPSVLVKRPVGKMEWHASSGLGEHVPSGASAD